MRFFKKKYKYEYPKVDLTATLVVQDLNTSKILIGLRGPDSDAFPNTWCLPGGFAHAGKETAEEAMLREGAEELGLRLPANSLTQFWTCSDPKVDPRGHIVNVCFYARFSQAYILDNFAAGDDLVALKWIYPSETSAFRDYGSTILAFNHNEIVRRFVEAIARTR
jgi:ADP-ribose pyrophosphatase YjhB (NUDIX family)